MQNYRTATISKIEKIMSDIDDDQDYLDLHIRGYRELNPEESMEAQKMAEALVPESGDEIRALLVLTEKKGSSLVCAPQGLRDIDEIFEEGIYLYDGEENVFFPYIIPESVMLSRDEFEYPSDIELGSVNSSEYK